MATTNNDCASREPISPAFVRWYNFFRWLVFGLLGVLLLALIGRSCVYGSIVAPTLLGPSGTVDVGSYALSGTGSPNSLVRVTDQDGTLLGETTVDADGNWTLTTSSLPEGRYEATATAYDPEGGERGDSNALLWTVAAGGAAAAVAEAADAVDFQVPTLRLPNGDVDPTSVLLSGTGTPGTTVEIFRNGVSVGTAEVDDNGDWSLNTAVEAYENEFEARGFKPDGELIGMSETHNLALAAAATGLAIVASDIGDFSADSNGNTAASVTLSGTGEPGTTVDLFANGERIGSTQIDADGTWTFTDSIVFEPGDVEISAEMTASDGTPLSTDSTIAVTVPTLTDADDAAGQGAGENAESVAVEISDIDVDSEAGDVVISGISTPGATIEITVDGDVVATITADDDGTWRYSGNFEPGDHAVAVRDVSGGSSVVASDAFVVEAADDGSAAANDEDSAESTATDDASNDDLSNAALDVKSIANVNDSPTIGTVDFGMSGTGRPGTQLVVLENGVPVGGATVQEDGTWSCTCSLPPGEHTLVVQAVDDPSYTSVPVVFTVENLTQLPPPPVESGTTFSCSGTPPSGEIRGRLYIVAQCESFGLIAERVGTTVADLLTYNPQVTDPRLIYPGQFLNIPSDAGCFDDNG